MSYQSHINRSKHGIVQVIDTLDIMTLLNDSRHFVEASMIICNEVASKYQCSRVSLGWQEGAYVEIKAISHMEKFDKKTEILKLLGQAMEESLDQDTEIHYPSRTNQSSLITLSHKAFSSQQRVENILSIPLRLDEKSIAVLTCERAVEFGEQETKVITSIVALLLLAVIPYPYRVEASFIIKTENMVLMPAPFDGYVKAVYVKAGDSLKAGSPILDLDVEELFIQESILTADIARYEREQRKHLISDELADMKIASSLKKQSVEKLKEIQFYINNSSILAKNDGVIVEGELDKMIGNESPMNWWRPGMTGIAKLDAGSHSMLWIMFKKTIDFIYLKLWW